MKILAISINNKEDNQTVSYEDDKGKKQFRVTPIIGEDGLLLQWMKDNPMEEFVVEQEPEAVPVPVKKEKPVKFFRGPKG